MSKLLVIPVGLLLVTGACSEGGADVTSGIEDVPEIAEPSADWNPQGQVICDEDFTRFTDMASFVAGAGCISNKSRLDGQPNNINVATSPLGLGSSGEGLWYRHREMATRCTDQIVGQANIPLPAGTREVWMEWDGTFSNNYSTVNPNCARQGSPDFKYVLVWTSGQATNWRADLKMGQGSSGSQIVASAPGYPQHDDAPVNGTVRVGDARTYFDGQPHHYRVAFRMLGSSQYEVYVEIDGVVTHNYVTNSITDAGLTFRNIMLGSNRNLGATEDLFLWWRNMKVWAR